MEPDLTFKPADAHRAMGLSAPVLSARPLLLVSDFDGTLSRIVMDPWGASIVPGAQRALRRLTRIEGVHVALLSGRLVRDLAGRARIGNATYVGNFGMERAWLGPRGRVSALDVKGMEQAEIHVAMADRLAVQVPLRVADPWLVVEHKPASVAFHFRSAPDVDAAALRVRAAVDAIDPAETLARHVGRRVLELRPPGAPAKGEAFRGLVAQFRPRAALVLGDDVSDVPAFLALRQARDAGTLLGLAIAVRARDEVPAAVVEAADLVLGSPAEAARFLTLLAAAVAASGAATQTGNRS
jgi:trehalose 6-phosphate phosphatase